MSEINLPDFSGKLVIFYTRNAPRAIQDGILLEYASFVEYGKKFFVIGRVPSTDSKGLDWVSNLQAGLAWEDVTHFMIFDSREEYIERMGKAKVPFLQRFTN